MITQQQIAHALGGEISGGQVLAPGPGHSAGDRSLSIKIDETAPSGFVVHSFSGDDPIRCKDYVRQKIGLPPFNGKPSTPSKPIIVAEYDYTDERGELLSQVVRYRPKGFRQRRPDGRGGWLWSLGNTRRVLYRLPELLESIAMKSPIFIAEGEQAVDALVKLGVPATCSPGGAGKWRNEYSKEFTGANVVILPDADEQGEQHAKTVSKLLTGIASNVSTLRLPGLPPKGDPYDWVEDGGTAEQIWNLVEQPERKDKREDKDAGWRAHTFTAAALRTMSFQPILYVVPGFLPQGLTLLAGRPKIGKSWLPLDIALAITTGGELLGGIKVEQGDVLYCALEDNKRRLQRRVTKLLSPFSGEWPERLTLATKWRRLDEGGVDDIKSWCDSVAQPRLVLLDTLAGVRATRNQSDTLYESDYRALLDVHRLAGERDLSVTALHHTRKMEAEDPLDTISGSLGLVGCADTALILARTPRGSTLYVRGRDVEECEHAVTFNSDTCRWTVLGDAAEVHRSESRSLILKALLDATAPMSPEEISIATGIKRNNVDQLLYKMVKDSEVAQIERGRYCHPNNAEMMTPHKTRVRRNSP